MTVGERIKYIRELKGYTQTELAKKMHYASKSAVSRTENSGDKVGSNRIKEFAIALDVSIAYLMGWIDEPLNYDACLDNYKDYNPQDDNNTLIEINNELSKMDERKLVTLLAFIKTMNGGDTNED
ncbi:MAG: helix-turn-helix transcriptional regulator [Bacteroidales bacterium]|nr:helix-turn-helix transcriptional regulator [Candidatus Scybalousia scybalohippi]